ncbi:MAG: hypothetical protein OQK73_12125 [Gammaproteobacteria bacterium]|nr:hypothetical protein [Gammaproteobacteria bacterium]
MREKIHQALTFSQEFVGHLIDVNNCPHHGYFTESDVSCIECEKSLECEWLNQDIHFTSPYRPLPELVGKLQGAICHIDSHLSSHGHDLPVCNCEACQWLRHAENLFVQVSHFQLRE